MTAELEALIALMPYAGQLGMFRPVTGGTVRAEAVPLHRGRTTVTVQTRMRDSQDRLVAHKTQVQAARPA